MSAHDDPVGIRENGRRERRACDGDLVERDGNHVIDGLQRDEADGEPGAPLRMNFGGTISAPSANRYLQIPFASRTRINCK